VRGAIVEVAIEVAAKSKERGPFRRALGEDPRRNWHVNFGVDLDGAP